MEQNANHHNLSNEIGLRELIQTIWESKLLIILITSVITCIAAAYAFLSTPVYETSVETLPPTISGLSSYNLGSQLTNEAISAITPANTFAAIPAGIKELNPHDAYQAFLQRLASNTVRQKFFDQIYLPAYIAGHDQINKKALRKKLDNELSISVPLSPNEKSTKIILQGTDPKTIADWANAYVTLAIEATQKDLISDLAGEISVRSKSIDNQIAASRKISQTSRQDRISQLESALHIAESIGLEAPANSGNLITPSSQETIYLRGAKALRAEIDMLEHRTNNDPYIDSLPDLLKKQALLKSIDINSIQLSVATIDQAATMPEGPVKPQKALILALGIILGVMVGIFLVLVRQMYKPS